MRGGLRSSPTARTTSEAARDIPAHRLLHPTLEALHGRLRLRQRQDASGLQLRAQQHRSPIDGPLCFDDGRASLVRGAADHGDRWAPITSPGKSTLCKCSLTAGGGTISLTLVNSWMIDDNYTGYGANAFSQTFSYKRISFDPSTKKINLWSTYQAAVSSAAYEPGLVPRVEHLSESFTRGPSSWTAGTPSTTQRSPRDLIGWAGGVDSLIVLKSSRSRRPRVSLFNIASGLERAYPIISTWAFSDAHHAVSMRAWTFVYSQESPDGSFEIYAFDEGLDSSGGVHRRDTPMRCSHLTDARYPAPA
jgi:hypothetical protein